MNLTLTPIRFKDRAESLFASKTGIIDGDVKLTYREYGERCDRLSNALTALGVSRGERVAWLGYNSHELLEAYYGVVQMGAVLLPLNIRLTPAEIAFILNDSESASAQHKAHARGDRFHPERLGIRRAILQPRLPANSRRRSQSGHDHQALHPA
jgi:acyl-CoA synthetase (AMP-forming)/AMP-acid ligase II